MKKILLTLAVVLLAACGGKETYHNYLPKDALATVRINPKSLGDKMNAGDFKESSYYKALDNMLAEKGVEDRELIMSLVADPKKSGLSVDNSVFIFVKDAETVGILAKVANRKNVDETVEKAGLQITTEGDRSVVGRMDDRTAVAVYDDKTLLFYAADKPYATVSPELQALLAQEKADGLMSIPEAAEVLTAKNDVAVVAAYGSMLKVMSGMMPQQMMGQMPMLEKAYYALGGNFEKGRVAGNAKLFFTDKEAEKAYMEFAAKISEKINGNLLKYFPEDAVLALCGNIHGAALVEFMENTPEVARAMRQMPPMKAFIEALDGDMMMAMTGWQEQGGVPVFVMMMELSKPDVITGFASMATSIGAKKTAENQYVFSMGEVTVHFGVKDNMLYATNDDRTVAALAGEKIDALGSGLFKGYGTILVNVDAGREILPKLNLDLDDEAVAFLEMFSNIEVTSVSYGEINVVMNMADKSKNAADVIYHTMEGFVKVPQ